MFDIRFEPLSAENHDPAFRCGNTWIDLWFEQKSLRFDAVRRTRTYLLFGTPAEQPYESLLGFFSIRAEAQYLTGLESQEAEVIGVSKYEPVPVVEIAYLARSLTVRGRSCGALLLVECVRLIYNISLQVGVAGAYLSSTSEGKRLYSEYGFYPMDDTRMYLPMRDIEQIVRDSG